MVIGESDRRGFGGGVNGGEVGIKDDGRCGFEERGRTKNNLLDCWTCKV